MNIVATKELAVTLMDILSEEIYLPQLTQY